MAVLPPSPKQSEFQKLTADMLQYVFDLETAVEERFHMGTLVTWCLMSVGFGWLLGHVI